jgi:hypothetical protein
LTVARPTCLQNRILDCQLTCVILTTLGALGLHAYLDPQDTCHAGPRIERIFVNEFCHPVLKGLGADGDEFVEIMLAPYLLSFAEDRDVALARSAQPLV